MGKKDSSEGRRLYIQEKLSLKIEREKIVKRFLDERTYLTRTIHNKRYVFGLKEVFMNQECADTVIKKL